MITDGLWTVSSQEDVPERAFEEGKYPPDYEEDRENDQGAVDAETPPDYYENDQGAVDVA